MVGSREMQGGCRARGASGAAAGPMCMQRNGKEGGGWGVGLLGLVLITSAQPLATQPARIKLVPCQQQPCLNSVVGHLSCMHLSSTGTPSPPLAPGQQSLTLSSPSTSTTHTSAAAASCRARTSCGCCGRAPRPVTKDSPGSVASSSSATSSNTSSRGCSPSAAAAAGSARGTPWKAASLAEAGEAATQRRPCGSSSGRGGRKRGHVRWAHCCDGWAAPAGLEAAPAGLQAALPGGSAARWPQGTPHLQLPCSDPLGNFLNDRIHLQGSRAGRSAQVAQIRLGPGHAHHGQPVSLAKTRCSLFLACNKLTAAPVPRPTVWPGRRNLSTVSFAAARSCACCASASPPAEARGTSAAARRPLTRPLEARTHQARGARAAQGSMAAVAATDMSGWQALAEVWSSAPLRIRKEQESNCAKWSAPQPPSPGSAPSAAEKTGTKHGTGAPQCFLHVLP